MQTTVLEQKKIILKKKLSKKKMQKISQTVSDIMGITCDFSKVHTS